MKAKHHEISLEELQEWYSNEYVTYASSSRERKRLECSLNGNFRVSVVGNVVWQGTQLYSAVEAYNTITDKYIDPYKDFKL